MSARCTGRECNHLDAFILVVQLAIIEHQVPQQRLHCTHLLQERERSMLSLTLGDPLATLVEVLRLLDAVVEVYDVESVMKIATRH
jgi:hypothetical protein